MKRALFVSLFAVAAFPLRDFSQEPKALDFQVSAGAISQEGQLGVRAALGATASAQATKRLPYYFSLGPLFSVAAFPAPEPFLNPGGCLGAQPCKEPSPSVVRIATLGIIGLYTPPTPDSYDGAPFLVAGVGMRHLTESPERNSDNRPYGEIGLGLIMAGKFVFRVEYQATQPGSELPRWAVPVTLGVAF